MASATDKKKCCAAVSFTVILLFWFVFLKSLNQCLVQPEIMERESQEEEAKVDLEEVKVAKGLRI